jgi:hypothetical protein
VVHPTASRSWTERANTLTALSFDAFDTTLGTLTGVSLAFTGAQDFTTGGSIVVPDGAALAMTSSFGVYTSDVAIAGQELESFTAPNLGLQGCTPVGGVCLTQATLRHDQAIDLALDDLAPFRAGAPVALDLSSTVILSPLVTVFGDPAPAITLLSSLQWSGQATLTYAYDPAVAAAVPEPAAWALMLAGFAGLGATLRGRRARAART